MSEQNKTLIVISNKDKHALSTDNIPALAAKLKALQEECLVKVEQRKKEINKNPLDFSKASDQKKLSSLGLDIARTKKIIEEPLRQIKRDLDAKGKAILPMIKDWIAFFDDLRADTEEPLRKYKEEIKRKKEELKSAIKEMKKYSLHIDEGGYIINALDCSEVRKLEKRLNSTFDTFAHHSSQDLNDAHQRSLTYLDELLQQKQIEEQQRQQQQQMEEQQRQQKIVDDKVQEISSYGLAMQDGGKLMEGMSHQSLQQLIGMLDGIVVDDSFKDKKESALQEKKAIKEKLLELYKTAKFNADIKAEEELEKNNKLLKEKLESIKRYQKSVSEGGDVADEAFNSQEAIQKIGFYNKVIDKLRAIQPDDFPNPQEAASEINTSIRYLENVTTNLGILKDQFEKELLKSNQLEQLRKVSYLNVVNISTVNAAINKIHYIDCSLIEKEKVKVLSDLNNSLNDLKLKQAEIRKDVKSNDFLNAVCRSIVKSLRNSEYIPASEKDKEVISAAKIICRILKSDISVSPVNISIDNELAVELMKDLLTKEK